MAQELHCFAGMSKTALIEAVRQKYELLSPLLTERLRRQWAACEAMSLPRGGFALVAQATGLSRTTLWAGKRELQQQTRLPPEEMQPDRIRRPGGGRHLVEADDATLVHDLVGLLESSTRGDPQAPLLWTSKSTRNLAEELNHLGHRVSHVTVAALLHDLDYSLQANRKTKEGSSHPDRDAQFEYINRQVRAFQKRGQPVVSVDTKKKELVGDFRNAGQEWHRRGHPEEVRAKTFPDKQLGAVIPAGVYDLTSNQGWVSVGIDHNTAAFAKETIRRWWQEMGLPLYPDAAELLVTVDGGGSNSVRSRLWKVGLQELADDLGLRIAVCHFPPGTSKWNKIEHRMFCHITQNWRGKPLRSRAVVVNLIGSTKTRTGLKVRAALDTNSYPTGIEVSDEELAAVQIKRARFHGDWNYTIVPR
jgi:Rhodopirellula transposase DDE domain